MNACKAIELALKDTLAQYAAVGEGVWIWGTQSATKDDNPSERIAAGRAFPMIRLTATPEGASDNAWTFEQPVEIAIATLAPDDPFCVTRGSIYEAVRGVISPLYFQALDRDITPHAELTYFLTQFSVYLGGGTINLGGIRLTGNPTPGNDGEVQTMSVNMVFDWSQPVTQPAAP